MKQRLIQAARRSRRVIILWTIYQNYLIRLRTGPAARFGFLADRRTNIFPVEETRRWIGIILDDYLRYGELGQAGLEGKSVLEIGPGDNFAIALHLVARGARQVVCLDKFYTLRPEAEQAEIYRSVLGGLEGEERRRADEAIQVDGKRVTRNEERIRYVCGRGVEEADAIFPPASFDLVLSRAVLEHLYDLDRAWEALDRVSRPGALHLHKVDFRDHTIFSGKGMHPLTFLTLSDRVWRWMTYHSGKPNRCLVDDHRRRLAALGYRGKLYAAMVLGSDEDLDPYRIALRPGEDFGERELGLIREIRPRLLPRYRALPDEDLLWTSAFLAVRKPA